MEKYLKKLGAGWTIETEKANTLRFNRQNGTFIRIIRFEKEKCWVGASFNADGTGHCASSYPSFKQVLAEINS